jgi:hypothetical protein
MDRSGRKLFEVIYPYEPDMADETPKKPVRDSNRKTPEYKLETSPFEPTYSVPNMNVLNDAH